MKKKLLIIIFLTLICLSLTSCGGNAKETFNEVINKTDTWYIGDSYIDAIQNGAKVKFWNNYFEVEYINETGTVVTDKYAYSLNNSIGVGVIKLKAGDGSTYFPSDKYMFTVKDTTMVWMDEKSEDVYINFYINESE